MSGFDVVTRGEVLTYALQARDYLVGCGVPAALGAKDPRLWGRRPDDHRRLGWLDLPFSSRSLIAQVEGLVDEVHQAGLDQIVLVGVGAEGLAAQAIAEAGAGTTHKGELTVLDGGDSAALQLAMERLDRTLVVLSSKVGVSIEGDAHRRVFDQAFRDLGMSDEEIAARFLVITDHDSPLHGFAQDRGYRVGLTDPYLPGHFGALSAYGLVPALLAGADAGALLDQAEAIVPSLGRAEDNPGLLLGAVLGGSAQQSPGVVPRDKVALRAPGASAAFTGWIAQLLATASGRRGRGIVPFDLPGRPDPDTAPDVHTVTVNAVDVPQTDSDTLVRGPLGAQFLLWEYAAAVSGWLMGVNPFDGGADVAQEAEDDAATMLRQAANGPLPTGRPIMSDGAVDVFTDPLFRDLTAGSGGLEAVLDSVLGRVPPSGYLTLISYLAGDLSGRYLAPALARRLGRPVAYGDGPGYLHGTGSLHKEGPGNGVFIVVTGAPVADRPVPGRPYSLGKLQLARALADIRSLRARGLPVLWLHLRDRADGAGRLTEVIRDL